MTKRFYSLLLCFLGLAAACGLLQGIIQFLIGAQLFFLDSFVPWFWVANIISLSGSVLLLKYYHHRKYWPVFSAGLISVIANTCYAIVIYTIAMSRKPNTFSIPALFLLIAAGIIYAACLIFSRTGKKTWLMTAGILTLILTLVLGATVILTLSSKNIQIRGTLEQMVKWTSLSTCLIPIPFILHFLGERRIQRSSPTRGAFENIMEILGILALIGVLTFGGIIAAESSSSLYWGNQNFEKTKALARLFEARTFVNGHGDTLFYRLLKPLDYDSTKKYPLVISLPYGAQSSTDKIKQLQGSAAAEILSEEPNRRRYPAFLFIPSCPPGAGWGGVPNYPSVDSLVYEAISSLDTQFGIDGKRRYVTGISRGGYGTWNFICTRPDLFAAAVPVCGEGNPRLAPKIVTIPVWAFHGAKDRNVPVSGSRDMISAIRKAGGDPKYTEFPDEGHNIWYQVSITPGLWDWMFAQKRD